MNAPIDITVPRRGDLPHRLQIAMREAESMARADGEQFGYMHGWRHGLISGLVLGATVATVCWALYLSIVDTNATPRATARPTVQTAQR